MRTESIELTSIVEAASALAARAAEFDYFTLTWHAQHGWKCHLKLAYSGTKYVDKRGVHIVDVYSFGQHPTDPREAVTAARMKLAELAQAKLDAKNEAPDPTYDTYLRRPSVNQQSSEDILKELGL